MTYAYVYIRFSSPKQEKGDSKERQLSDALALCERHGWTVVEPIIEDLGVSAWKGDNLNGGNLGRFAQQVFSGEIEPGSVLVVENLDRISREEPRKAQRWIEDITDTGLRIATVHGNKIYDRDSLRSESSIGEIFEIILAAKLAKKHSDTISSRVRGAWVRRREAASNGKVISAKLPGWLRIVGEGDQRQIQPIPERADVVREIYRMAADGIGARTIAKTLNMRRVRSFGKEHHRRLATSEGWEHTYVGEILSSASVEGDYEPTTGHSRRTKTGQKIVGYFGAPIVDADTVARARAAIASRRGTGGRGRSTRVSNLFSGLIFCHHCNSTMVLTGNSVRPGTHLYCGNASRGRGCHQRSGFFYPKFERAALDAILHLALDDRYFLKPDNSRVLSIQLAETNKEIADRKADAQTMLDLLLKRPSPTIETRLAETEVNIATLEATTKELEVALMAARGAVSPAEHIRRVMEVRGALDAEDEETRVAARLKVAEAIKAVDCKVVCAVFEDHRLPKQFHLTILGTMAKFTFDNDGRLIGDYDLVGEVEDFIAGLTPEQFREVSAALEANPGGKLPPDIQKMMDAFLKRRG